MRVLVVLCAAEVLTMVGVFAFPALLPLFSTLWDLSATQSGWIGGVYFAGYALAVPVLMALTDRVDARGVFMAGAALAGVAALGFALAAEGFWTALAFRFLAGLGLAGTYMPGLKALVDRLPGPAQARAIPWYTACFSLGTALSFLAVGGLATLAGWRAAFVAAGLAALLAAALAVTLAPFRPEAPPARLLDFRPVLRNRPAMGYVLGYAAHMWELFGLRSWQVAFLAFAAAGAAARPDPNTVATLGGLAAMLASIAGAHLCLRFGRHRVIALSMGLSAAMAFAVGAAALLSYEAAALAVVVYGLLVQLDSAALTTGAVQSAETGRRGATIALHSTLGFAAAFAAPLAVGMVLDAAGGPDRAAAWIFAFAVLGGVGALGPAALAWSRRLP